MPETQDQAFAMINSASGGTCFVSDDGPALVNEIAMIQFSDGSTQLVSDYLEQNPQVFE